MYTAALCAPAAAYGFAIVMAGWSTAAPADQHVVVFLCKPPTALRDWALSLFVGSNVMLCVCVLGVYFFTYQRAKKIGKFRRQELKSEPLRACRLRRRHGESGG